MPVCDASRASAKRPVFFIKLRSAVLWRFDLPFRGEAGIERNHFRAQRMAASFVLRRCLKPSVEFGIELGDQTQARNQGRRARWLR